MSSYQSAPAQRVPAWKRLGLKLKGPASGESPIASSAETANPSDGPHVARVNGSPASVLKRKPVDVTTQTPSKRLRIQDQTSGSRKSVAFTEDTKPAATADAKKPKKDKPKKKKPKKAAADPASKSDTDLEPSLAYLRQWHTDRASWKFNKNHQTLLIKYLFDADRVPSTDIAVFYQYIRDLKGFVRTRLRETAEEIKKNDMEQGTAGFPAPTKNKDDKQKTYDDILAEFVKDQIARQNQTGPNGVNANGKRSFDEVELAIRLADPVIKQRLLKRIRAEMVTEELSDTESTTSVAATTTASSSSSSAKDVGDKTAEPSAKRTESQQPTKRRRLRKVRTNVDDDSSSDSSSSDSDSSSDNDSGSDEDSSEDETMGDDSDGEGSSSGSSSESESDAEEDAAGGNESESSESSSSSDDE